MVRLVGVRGSRAAPSRLRRTWHEQRVDGGRVHTGLAIGLLQPRHFGRTVLADGNRREVIRRAQHGGRVHVEGMFHPIATPLDGFRH